MQTVIKRSNELQVGDVVRCHGGRFRLTEAVISAENAEAVAKASVSYEHAQKDGPGAVARYLDLNLSLRCFRTAFLGPTNPERTPDMPSHWLKGWTVQGNNRATWTVEARAAEAK